MDGHGGNDLWSTSGNWTAGTPVTNADTVVFNGDLTMSNSNTTADLDIPNLTVAGLELISSGSGSIGSPRPGFDLISSSDQTLTIGSSSYAGFIESTSTAVETVSINLDAGSALSISGGVILNNDGALDLNGSLNNEGFLITESGLTKIAGNITGAGGLTVNGNLTLGGQDSYSGATQVTGNLTVQNGSLSGTPSIVVASGATLSFIDASVSGAPSVQLDGSQLSYEAGATNGLLQFGQLSLQADTTSHILLQQEGSTSETALSFSGVTAPTTDTILWVSGNNLGAAAGTNGSSRVIFASAPTTVGGGGAVRFHHGGRRPVGRGFSLHRWGAPRSF